jgi:hypothetical protein
VSGKFINRAYWACTTLLSALMLLSGAGDLLRLEAFVEDLRRLGYPGYLLTVLGIAKLLGVSALLYPGMPRLKEWAYAGFTFDLGGATISQVLSGPTVARVMPPMLCGLVLASSYLAYRMREHSKFGRVKETVGE